MPVAVVRAHPGKHAVPAWSRHIKVAIKLVLSGPLAVDEGKVLARRLSAADFPSPIFVPI
jgi:hypothetical protein